ncbi:hypothetical protein PPN31114_00205 [Pandoraea pneumonica]|uniref:Uncharacterized protein n=1 Tax=Pandoraea pneumonica TaxID=2508299 RepID=A0A5E4RM34_9BURK|nr:hypothetical protein [Pandoraea pneumonica]VVD63099.1 hypothetical protein PPN31114_00205 [Pandoraea pneumonica]
MDTSDFHFLDAKHKVERQARRLQKHLNVRLRVARAVLAEGPYQCKSWESLLARLACPTTHIRMLASLPGDNRAEHYLSANLDGIARSIAQQIMPNTNLAGLYDIVRKMFLANCAPTTLEHVAPSLPPLAWEPANLGPDAYAVMYANANVNGNAFRVVATRTYLPDYLDFGAEVDHPELAYPVGKFKIVWTNPDAWLDAARTYLFAPKDEWDVDLALPEEILDEHMAAHERWFTKALATMPYRGEYSEELNERPIPYFYRGDAYLLFGLPTVGGVNRKAPNLEVEISASDANGGKLFSVEGVPMLLEWSKAQAELGDDIGEHRLANTFVDAIASDSISMCFDVGRTDVGPSILMRPACGTDIRLALKLELMPTAGEEAFVLRSDSPELAEILVAKIAARQILVDRTVAACPRYAVALRLPRNVRGLLQVGLEVRMNKAEGVRSNLIPTTYIEVIDDDWAMVYFPLGITLLALLEALGKWALIDAVVDGRVIRRPIGFEASLANEPAWTKNLLDSGLNFDAMFCGGRKIPLGRTAYELLRTARVTKYARDFY